MQETVTKDRELYIGGSDMPAVMGISPFTSRFDLLKYKAGVEENEFKGNEFTEYGNVMEEKIRNFVNTLGWNFKEEKIILADSEVLPIRYHADGTDKANKTVLEVKTTSQIHHDVNDYKVYLVQLLTGMWAFGYGNGVLAVYERPEDMSEDFDKDRLQVFIIGMEDYEGLMNEIHKAIGDFRADYMFLLDNPWCDEADLPSRTQLMSVATQLMGLEASIATAQAVVDQYGELKKELCKQMEEHGVKSWTMPNGTKVTLVPRGKDSIVKAFDETRFKEEHEELYGEYTVDKVKKGKSAYVRVTPMAKGE